jgi:hypothetical protein
MIAYQTAVIKAGWPSWLWRQVKVYLNIHLLVRETERGFKSHSCHYSFALFVVAVMLKSHARLLRRVTSVTSSLAHQDEFFLQAANMS